MNYPVDPLRTREEIDAYFATDLIVCLLCGFEYGMLATHLVRTHGVSCDQYRIDFGLPMSIGLSGTVARAKCAATMHRRIAEGDESIIGTWRLGQAVYLDRKRSGISKWKRPTQAPYRLSEMSMAVKGERNPMAKLNDQATLVIRHLYRPGTCSANRGNGAMLAGLFGVSQHVVRNH